MKIAKLAEYGYEEAALGFSLSYNTSIERTKQILPKYAFGIPGESKFLESIQLWFDVTAPRFWWQEADTYRVGSSKQSESTMHTICKNALDYEDFEYPIDDYLIHILNKLISSYKNEPDKLKRLFLFQQIKNNLPEGFLQRRIWNFNYKTLQNMYNQRRNHRLPQWKVFLDKILETVEHPEFITKGEDNVSN